MKPYYSDDRVTLYHGDCREVLASMADQSVAAVLTDPPYTERTHGNAKTNKGKGHGVKALTFDAITDGDLSGVLAECGRVSRGWVVATLAYQHTFAYDETPPDGLRCLRLGVWIKTGFFKKADLTTQQEVAKLLLERMLQDPAAAIRGEQLCN